MGSKGDLWVFLVEGARTVRNDSNNSCNYLERRAISSPKDARPNYNRAALTLLPVFGVIFAYALERGDRFGREEKITAELGHSEFAPAQQAEFISSSVA
jgi:hypothetical protein